MKFKSEKKILSHNLPTSLSSFVGREREQAEVRQLLSANRLVREKEVALLIARSKSNCEIAEAMMVGVKIIETYITRILHKLGLDTRVQIARWAVEKGLVLR